MNPEKRRNTPTVLILQIVSLAVFLLLWEWAAKRSDFSWGDEAWWIFLLFGIVDRVRLTIL